MSDRPRCRFSGGFVAVFIGMILLGMSSTTLLMLYFHQTKMVEYGCASYDTQTGVFTPKHYEDKR